MTDVRKGVSQSEVYDNYVASCDDGRHLTLSARIRIGNMLYLYIWEHAIFVYCLKIFNIN